MSDAIDISFSLVFLCVNIALPVFSVWFLFRFTHSIEDEGFSQRYGAIYEGYKNEKKTTKWYIGYFYLRRLLISICCVYLINYPVFQIQLYIALSLTNVIFIILAKPYEGMRANYTEVFNELTILGVSIHLLVFTDFVPDPQI